jgi:hypothetical protein
LAVEMEGGKATLLAVQQEIWGVITFLLVRKNAVVPLNDS